RPPLLHRRGEILLVCRLILVMVAFCMAFRWRRLPVPLVWLFLLVLVWLSLPHLSLLPGWVAWRLLRSRQHVRPATTHPPWPRPRKWRASEHDRTATFIGHERRQDRLQLHNFARTAAQATFGELHQLARADTHDAAIRRELVEQRLCIGAAHRAGRAENADRA